MSGKPPNYVMQKLKIDIIKQLLLLLLVMLAMPVCADDEELSARVSAARDTGYWQVDKGESLLGIARAFYPLRTNLHSRLINDVTGLNFDIFGGVGRDKFKPGVRIKLPDYILSEQGLARRKSEAEAKKKQNKPKAVEPVAQKQKFQSTVKPEFKQEIESKIRKERPAAKKAGAKKEVKTAAISDELVSARVKKARSSGVIQVKPGENMFNLARLFFPQRPRAQQLFIQDMIKSNPEVFTSAEINAIPVGTDLKLPSYVWGQEKKETAGREIVSQPTPGLPTRHAKEEPIKKDQQVELPGSEKLQAETAKPEKYVDQYMTESELSVIESAEEKEDRLPGRRLLEVEYQYYLNRDDFIGDETEQGLHTRYRRETLNYGELDFELSLSDFTQDDDTQNHEGSDALVTIRQIAMPIANDFLLNNSLGHQRTQSDHFLHGGYRFRLPTSPMLGYSADLSSSSQRIQWFAGVTGTYEGVALQQFDDDGGTLIGAAYQQEITPNISLGAQISNLQGHDEVDDHSSILLAGKYAPPDNIQSHELHLLGDDNSKFGVWSDSKHRLTPGMVFRYGGFYLEPDLLWTDADIADDQLGLYLRLDKQGFRNNFSIGYDFFETGIENDALITSTNQTVYFNNNYRVNRRLTLGVASSVSRREFTSTESDLQDSWRVNGFIYYRFPLGTSRFEILASELDSDNPANSRESNRLRWSHDWKTPQRYRLTTELSAENEKLFGDELQQYTASLIYRQEVLDNLSWGANVSAIRSDSDQLGTQDGASAGIDARWQMSPYWYTSLSANYNETTTDASTSGFFDTDNNIKTDGLWLTVGYAKTSGRPYPNFGIRNGSSGSGGISGVVFFDENRDGIRQVGEKLVQGVVILLDGRYEVRTDNRGRFEYRPVPSGGHHVRLAVEDLPLPWGLDDETPTPVDVRVRQTTEVNFPLVRVDQ